MPRKQIIQPQQSPIRGFQGLKLRDAAEGIPPNACLDGLDFVLDGRGNVVARDGFTFSESISAQQLVTYGCPNPTLTDNVFCSPVKSQLVVAGTSIARGAVDSAVFGLAGGSPRTYFAAAANNTPFYLEGTAFTAPSATSIDPLTLATTATSMPRASKVCAWPKENRLIFANIQGTADGPCKFAGGALGSAIGDSLLIFSEPNLPHNFRSDAWILLGPGDGEGIQDVVSWRDQIFVFKKTKFYVITTTTANLAGAPVFNYRSVDVGLGAMGPSCVAVGHDGVYFVSQNGIQRTRGSDPQLASEDVLPLWGGPINPFFTGSQMDRADMAACQLEIQDDQMWLYVPDGAGRGELYVYDLTLKYWTRWDPCGGEVLVGTYTKFGALIQVCDHAGYQRVSNALLAYPSTGTTATRAMCPSPGAINMDLGYGAGVQPGSPWVQWRYRGGFMDFADSIVRIRNLEVAGRGAVKLSAYQDFKRTPQWTEQLHLHGDVLYDALGATTGLQDRAYGSKMIRRGLRCSRLSLEVGYGESQGPAAVSRLVVHTGGQRHGGDSDSSG